MLFKEDIQASYLAQKGLPDKEGVWVAREYLKTQHFTSSHVEVVAGIRRCGKSTLMRQIARQYFMEVAYFNFEDSRVFGFEVRDFPKLAEVMGNEVEAYFFDEIQNVPGWEVFVRQLHEAGKKVFVTGSNASLLSRELGTRLTGRYLQHEVFPFSYQEFLAYKKEADSTDQLMNYLHNGGFPEFLESGNPEMLQMLLKDILFRDIAIRHGIKNTQVLMEIALFLVSNVGKEVSYNGIRKAFGVGSPTTVSDYLAWFQDAYLFFYLPRFSWSVKSQAANAKKVYAIDTGFARANSLSFTRDSGRLLENLVFLCLRRRYSKLFFFRDRLECDFVVFDGADCKWVVQVCERLYPDNRDREVAGLVEAMEVVKMSVGYILTLDQDDSLEWNGREVIVMNVRKFMQQLSD